MKMMWHVQNKRKGRVAFYSTEEEAIEARRQDPRLRHGRIEKVLQAYPNKIDYGTVYEHGDPMNSKKITNINVDLCDPEQYPLSAGITIWRGGGSGTTKRYPATPANMRRIQRITMAEGAVRASHSPSAAMWYRNVDGLQYASGQWGWLVFKVNPDWTMTITIDPEYLDEVKENYPDAFDPASGEFGSEFDWVQFEWDLMGYALYNGWMLDPHDDGRWSISLDASLDNYGDLDTKPGDLWWDYGHRYAIESWAEVLIRKGSVTFRPYYMGEVTLDDQRLLW